MPEKGIDSVRGGWTIAGFLVLSLVVASCASSDGVDERKSGAGSEPGGLINQPSGRDDQLTSSSVGDGGVGLPTGPSALEDPHASEYPDPLVDPNEIISGGPPPDGIPPIDEPVFHAVSENLGLLPDGEPVIALEIDGDARAYPVRVMVWHEIVNDTVGGIPVSVTYCPLCNSAVTYARTIEGVETTFGTSGMLYASALVMYDRATESLWTHYNGEAVVGLLAGSRLDAYPSPLLSWADFRDSYPNGLVLDWARTGFTRSYGTNPYVGYDDEENTPFLFRGALDGRNAAMKRVVGIEVDGESVAVTLDLVRGDGTGPSTTTVRVAGRDLVVLWTPGQSSALDTSEIGAGYDVGSVGVFESMVGGRATTFAPRGQLFEDEATGSSWTITGAAIDGLMAGQQLIRVAHLDTFWFAWSTYQPGTRLVEG